MPLCGPGVSGGFYIKQQADDFYGTRPMTNPIGHSQKVGTRACKVDVKASDLTVWVS